MTRRGFLGTIAASAAAANAAPRRWKLGINTYCLRFQRWDDRRLMDYCVDKKLDAMFLQDSLDPKVFDPAHWGEVKSWSRDAGLHLETGGAPLLPRTMDALPQKMVELRRHIDRAKGMGSPIVRTLVAGDRYSMPDSGPVEKHVETALKILRELKSQVVDAGIKMAIENHKDLQAWQTRELIEAAGKDFVGSYLDAGNPVFVAEHPLTTIEELGPVAVCLHLRDSVVYEVPDGIAVKWVPLGEGTVDFKALLARAAEILPDVYVYCKPITARPPVTLPVYTEEWGKWFPRGRTKDFSRFAALAKKGQPYNKPEVAEDDPKFSAKYMDALKIQQIDHMERSLAYCKGPLDLGARWRG